MHPRRQLTLALSPAVLVALLAVSCAPPTAQESEGIAARSAEWVAAFEARDVDALVALYTDDARVLPPNAAAMQGADAVRGVFAEMIDAGLSGDLQSIETMEAGDLGYHVGTYSLGIDGDEVDRGKFIEIWRKVDGVWLITADMFSSDLPAVPEGDMMIAVHEVEDAERWLAAWRGPDGRRAMFAANGASWVHTFQNTDNPNLTGLLIGVTDMAALTGMIDSEEGAAAKAADGVIDPIQVFVPAN